MPLITQSIPSLLNGVSQQPPIARALDQCAVMDNFYPSLARGLVKRPALEYLWTLDGGSSVDWSSAFVHVFDWGAGQRYALVIGPGATVTTANTKIINLDTLAISTITGSLFFNSFNPRQDLRALTVGKTLLVFNVAVTTQRGTALGTVPTSFGTVQTVASLPAASGVSGAERTVRPSLSSDDGAFYVVSDGVTWNEAAHYDATDYLNLNDTTMPFVLNLSGAFTLTPVPWTTRKVGTNASGGQIGFMGSEITNAFVYRNRLGFISSNGYISLSRAGVFYDFFPRSVRATTDDDPISVAPRSGGNPYAALPFNKDLLLFTEKAQLLISGGEVLKPSSIRMDVAANFPSSSSVTPIAHGASSYFVTTKGVKAGLQEVFVEPNSLNLDAADLTAHVPYYLPSPALGPTKLTSSLTEDLVLYLDPVARNTFYGYKFYWKDQTTKAQSAWFTVSLASGWTILDAQFLGSKCYFFMMQTGSTRIYLATMDFSLSSQDRYYNLFTSETIAEFDTRLDMKERKSGIYDTATNTTYFPISSVTNSTWTYYIVPIFAGLLGKEWCGVPFLATIRDTGSIQVPGDFTGNQCFVGIAYNSSFTFSEQFKRDQNDRPSISGRLQLRDFQIRYEQTGYLKATVTADQRAPVDTIMGGEWVAWPGHKLGRSSIRSGVLKVPVQSVSSQAAITLSSISPLPVTVTSVEVTGFYHSNAKGR